MNSSPILSVIVPVYKVAKYLPQLLTRIANQTIENIEVILVCDGDEADLWICQKFVESDSRFKLITDVKKGLGGARNVGIDSAKGQYIFFCDADDLIDLDFCEKMLSPFFLDSKIGFTACGTEIVFEDGEDLERKSSDEKYFMMPPEGMHLVNQDLFGGLNVAVWNKVYRKDIMDKYQIRFPEKSYNEDAYFNWCYWSVSQGYYVVSDVRYSYIRRDSSLMGQTFSKSLGIRTLDHLKVAEMFYSFLSINGLLENYEKAFWNCYLISFWFARDNSSQEWQHKVKQSVTRFLREHHLPSDKKYQELANIASEYDSQPFHKIYKNIGNKCAITAILPVFKCEEYLKRCVDSVLSQTLSNIEVILAVDGGEACYAICDEYALKDSRVRVIRDQGSYGKSVNAGICSAQGEYVAIIECDDWCEPNMFETLFSAAKQYDADVVKGGWFDSFDDKSKEKVRVFNYKDGLFNIYEHQDFFASQPSVWSAIYRKEYLIQNNIFFYEERQSFVDSPFHYKTLYCTPDYVLINKPLYHYYQDNPNQSVQSGGKVYDGVNAERFAYDDIKQYPDLWQRIGHGVFLAMLSHLCWNDHRIKDKVQHKEFERVASEFLSSIDMGPVNVSDVSSEGKNLLDRLLPSLRVPKLKNDRKRTIFRLLGFLPLFSIEYCGEVTKIKLFSLINIVSLKQNASMMRCTLLKVLPLFVIRRKW